MSFRENLSRKITLDRAAADLTRALPAARQDYQVIDKEKMRRFLGLTSYRPLKLRDLELYQHGGDGRAEEVLVLDNELPLYRDVAPEEVALRRSPEVKEMFSLANLRKILNESDILIAKGRRSVAYIHDEAVAELDLRYGAEDIRELVDGGGKALLAGRMEELAESLELLFELLGYQEMEGVDGERLFGRPEPEGFRDIVMWREADGGPSLRLAKSTFTPENDESMEELAEVVTGVSRADAEGPEVLAFLGREVMRLKVA